MSKKKIVSQKKVMATYKYVIAVPYCGLQTLLRHWPVDAYTEHEKGRVTEVYRFEQVHCAIVMGHTPFGNAEPSCELLKKYENAAERVLASNESYEYALAWLDWLIGQFIAETVGKRVDQL